MTTTNEIKNQPLFTSALKKRMLIGAGIALLMISFFVIAGGPGQPSWGPYWRIKPLLLTPFLGAIIGLCFDVTERLRRIDGWAGRMFYLLSILGALVGLWMSLILGMAGTMWN